MKPASPPTPHRQELLHQLGQALQRHPGLFRVGRSAASSRDACEVAHPGLPHGRLIVRLDDLQQLVQERAVHLYAGQLGGAFTLTARG